MAGTVIIELRERFGRLEGLQMGDIVGGLQFDKQRSLLDLRARLKVDRLDDAGNLRTEVGSLFRPRTADGLQPFLPWLRRRRDGGNRLRGLRKPTIAFINHSRLEGFKPEDRRESRGDQHQHDRHSSKHQEVPSNAVNIR